MPTTPFVVGQWVRGEKFYGRAALIREILEGPRDSLWVLGTRRIGKTSLLRQVEHLTASAPERGYFPLFFSLEGAADPRELHLNFHDSLIDAERRLAARGIGIDEVAGDELFSSLARLRRRLRQDGSKLLLLCDEVEELIQLQQQDPSLLRKLRRALQAQDDMRSVLASTIRLWALADARWDTSPFLSGFEPPLFIHNLADDEARALIGQVNLPSDSRPRFDDATVESIRTLCDNHPYLVQLLCRSCLERASLEEAVEHVAADPMVAFFFGVDFDMLSEHERRVIHVVARRDTATSESLQQEFPEAATGFSSQLLRLEHLGYLRKDDRQRYVLANHFFRRWIKERGASRDTAAAGDDSRSSDTATMLQALPDVVDARYELRSRVGGGGMGVVHEAYDRLLRTPIALKVIRPEHAASADLLERLRREILLARDIAHPNVVRVYHLGEFQGRPYLTMQWMSGPTLAEVIARDGPLSPSRAIGIAIKLASALQAAHALRVLHRDIKPSNVLFDGSGEPCLADFGLARLLGDASLTSHGMFVGTPDYASPEQVATRPLDERSDLYSLGVVLFEMVTGRRPFRGSGSAEVLEQQRSAIPPVPQELNPAVPVDLSNLILRCLEKEPTRRFHSAGELRLALERIERR